MLSSGKGNNNVLISQRIYVIISMTLNSLRLENMRNQEIRMIIMVNKVWDFTYRELIINVK